MSKCRWIYVCALVFSFSSMHGDQKKMDCTKALERLVEGNQRYRENRLLHPNRSEESRVRTALAQSPFAIILGCSDSRVSPEIVFDQGIGDLFIVRVAGNVLGPIELASIEFAAFYLGSSVVVVLGHENCGAVKAVMEGQTKEIEAVASLIEPAVEKVKKSSNPSLKDAVVENVKHVVSQLKINPALSKLIKDKRLGVIGGYYDFLTGEVIMPLSEK